MARSAARRSFLRAAILWWMAAAMAAVLILVSVWQVLQLAELKAQQATQASLNSAHSRMSVALAAQDLSAARATLNQLVLDPRFGFVWLEWRSVDGALLGRAGRHDQLDLPLLADAFDRRIQAWLNERGDQAGRLRLPPAGQAIGASWLVYQLHDPSGDGSGISIGYGGPLTGLLLGLALAIVLFLRRDALLLAPQLTTARAEPERVLRERRRPDPSGPELGRSDLGQALGALQRAVLVVDAGQRIRYLNPLAARLTGWAAIDALGSLAYSVLHPLGDDDQPLKLVTEQVQSSGQPAQVRCRLRARDGTVHAVEMLAAPFSAGSGHSVLLLLQDLSGEQGAAAALAQQLERAEQTLDHLPDAVIRCDEKGVIEWANASTLRLFGYRAKELVGLPVTKLIPVPFMNSPNVRLVDFVGLREARSKPRVVGWRKDATTFPVELSVERVPLGDGSGLLLLLRDATESLRAQNLGLRLGRLLDEASQEILVFDAQSLYFTEVNQGARRNLGYEADDLARMSLLDLCPEASREELDELLEPLRAGEQPHAIWQKQHRRADGSDYAVRFKIQYSRDEQPPVFLGIGGPALED